MMKEKASENDLHVILSQANTCFAKFGLFVAGLTIYLALISSGLGSHFSFFGRTQIFRSEKTQPATLLKESMGEATSLKRN